jgi:hypothetical protein
MSMDWSKILESLGGRRAGTLPSAGPGTGPTEHDSVATPPRPGFLGGNPIPATTPPTESGYGGTGDPTPPDGDHTPHSIRRGPSIPGTITPRLNGLYGPLRTTGDAWRFVNSGYATGTWTPANGAQLLPVNLVQSNPIPSKLYQWAGAVSVYWVIEFFAFAPVASTMTGNQAVAFICNAANNPIPLGVYQGSQSGLYTNTTLIDAAQTDPNVTNLGNLQITGSTIAVAAVCTWQMGIGLAYLLPDPLYGNMQRDPALTREQEAVLYNPT